MREFEFLSVKKHLKQAKKPFTHTFDFHVEKKTPVFGNLFSGRKKYRFLAGVKNSVRGGEKELVSWSSHDCRGLTSFPKLVSAEP